MDEILTTIKGIENQIEQALWTLEMHGEIGEALDFYLDAESKLAALNITTANFAYKEQQRVLSYCFMRQGNILRQMKMQEEAFAVGEREMAAARASGDEVTLARSLMSNGVNYITTGKVEKGLALTRDACELFENGDSYDHQQGLGWYWILQADLANAGVIEKEPSDVVKIADRAMEILKPLENWPGIARAHAARAKAHENLGNEEKAAKDREEQRYYEGKVEPRDSAD